MALGKCVNISKPCSKAINREEIEADKSNFVCPECGKPLVEIKDKKKVKTGDKPINWKLIAGIIAAVVVLAGAGFGVWKFLNSEGGGIIPPKPIYVEKLALQDSVLSLKLNDKKQIPLTVTPEINDETIKWSSSDTLVASISSTGEITAKKPGKATILATTNLSNKNAKIEVTVKNPNGPIDLGYGVYTGDVKNGKPHGHGIIRYTKNHQIVSWKDFVASPGDTFEGDFRDGKITGLGYWKRKSDGNIIAIQ